MQKKSQRPGRWLFPNWCALWMKSISAPCNPRESHSEGCSAVSQRFLGTERLSPFVLKPTHGAFDQETAGWLCDRTLSGHATGRLAVNQSLLFHRAF